MEDVEHFLLGCGNVVRVRERLDKRMEEVVDGFRNWCNKEKVVLVLEEACSDGRAGRAIEKMWVKRFV